MKTRGAVIVTRVSTDEQIKGTSLEEQREACRRKALEMNLPIIAEYEDAGISGAFLLTREGMQAAIADIQAGRADTLICANISRYSRDIEHQQRILKDIKAVGGRIEFCDFRVEDTPAGDMMFSFMGGYAQYERMVIRERTIKGRRKRAEDGIQVSRCYSPYGYHIPTNADVLRGLYPPELLGKYVLIPEQAAVVKRIFECYGGGTHGMNRICSELNQEGVPTPRGAAIWQTGTLKCIIVNPVHKGEPAYGKVKHSMDEDRMKETHPITGLPFTTLRRCQERDKSEWVMLSAPAIVSKELWQTAQERRAFNKAKLSGNPARVRMLAGRIRCPNCGGGMSISRAEHDYYVCSEHRERQFVRGERYCVKNYYQIERTEQAVIASLAEAAEHPESVREQIAVYLQPEENRTESISAELATVRRALLEMAKDESVAVQAQIAGIRAGASPEAYSAVFQDLGLRRKALEERRAALQIQAQDEVHPLPRGDKAVREQALIDLHTALTGEHLPGSEKRDLIGMVVEKVIPRKDGAEIVYLPGLLGVDTVKCIRKPSDVSAGALP